jgi:diguanylate cyclase (GGDEF)-like protein
MFLAVSMRETAMKDLTRRDLDQLFNTLRDVTSLITAGRQWRLLMERLMTCCLDQLPAERVHLILLENDRLVKHSCWRDGTLHTEELDSSSGIRSWILREGVQREHQLALSLDLSLVAKECLDLDDTERSIVSAPLVAKEAVYGILVAVAGPHQRFVESDGIRLITLLANHLAIALENSELYRKLEVEAITDGLTGVYNYRFLIRTLDLEIKRATRFREVFSFMMIDVDNLKEYNDEYGHLRGSQALKDMGGILLRTCRDIDMVFKYGGDEFAVILPRTDLSGASTLAHRIVEAVRSFSFPGQPSTHLTVSIGIAVFPYNGLRREKLIEAADQVLYQAKHQGKNRFVSSLPEEHPPPEPVRT